MAAPGLIRELPAVNADRLIETRQKSSGQRREEHGRTLVRDEGLAIDHEFVAAGFAAEDGVIFEHEARPIRAGLAFEKQRGRQTADAAAHHHTIELLARVD